jgi:hypothetical protein
MCNKTTEEQAGKNIHEKVACSIYDSTNSWRDNVF